MSNKPVTQRVENLLKYLPELRNSDKLLLLAYWRKEGLDLSAEQERKFMLVTTAESITRARRALRAKYPGSKEVEEVRFTKYVEARDEYGQPIMVIDKR